MTASIIAPPEYDLVKIATSSGQPDVEKRFYREGALHVEGVTQEALDAALAAYDHAAYTASREALQEIAALEGQVTQRRLRDAALTDEGKAWLQGIEDQIAVLRGAL